MTSGGIIGVILPLIWLQPLSRDAEYNYKPTMECCAPILMENGPIWYLTWPWAFDYIFWQGVLNGMQIPLRRTHYDKQHDPDHVTGQGAIAEYRCNATTYLTATSEMLHWMESQPTAYINRKNMVLMFTHIALLFHNHNTKTPFTSKHSPLQKYIWILSVQTTNLHLIYVVCNTSLARDHLHRWGRIDR